MGTLLELAHILIRGGVFEGYYADLDTIYLHSSDGRGASISQYSGTFLAARNYGPKPPVMHGSIREVLEHLNVG